MRPKILMVAYACNPEAHGEHWLGWGWVEQAAQLGEVHLITPTWAQEPVTRHAAKLGIKVYFPEVSPGVYRLTQPLGNNGLWIRQYVWQHQVARLAGRLHREHRFDVVHQTTFHTFRVPFRAAFLGIPAVWGPIAGGESSPPGFGRYLGKARVTEAIRPVLNGLCLAQPAVQRSLRQARRLLVSNRTTLNFLPSWCREKSRVVPANALREDQIAGGILPRVPSVGFLRLLYLGNFIPVRSIPLVLEALVAAKDVPIKLTIAGDGPAGPEWRQQVARLGLQDRVEFPGRIALAELPTLYSRTDALVFPSLRDSGGSSLLEAMSLGVPVVCFDWAGPGEIVSERSGIKIPVRSPAETISALAAAFRRLWQDPGWAAELGAQAAAEVREKFTWAKKQEMLADVYQACLTSPPKTARFSAP